MRTHGTSSFAWDMSCLHGELAISNPEWRAFHEKRSRHWGEVRLRLERETYWRRYWRAEEKEFGPCPPNDVPIEGGSHDARIR